MIGTLIRKEISEHWIPICGLLTLLGGCTLLISAYVTLLEAGSVLDGHRLFMSFFMVMAALFLNHRLVTLEYRGHTQLFLEALPVTRPAMITVKLALGWSLLTLVALLDLYWLAFWGRNTEPITWQFLGILTCRTVGFVSFTYLFTFMMSMLGRYKIPLYLTMVIGLIVFVQVSGFELQRFGPIGLIWDRMEYENELIPWTQLNVSAGLCLGLLALIFSLALVREGALAGMLAEKMSQREKLFIAACLLTGLATASLTEKLAIPEPFELADMHVIQVGRAQVATSTADELASYLGDQLEAVCDYLRIEHPPKVWVTDRKDLDVHRFERGELKDNRSLLLRANVQHPKFDRNAFAAFMIHEFLDVHTRGRVKTEAKMWYWDGFGLYWINRTVSSSETKWSNDESLPIRLRAAVAFHDQPLTEDQIRQWRKYRRAVGHDLAQSTAAVGIASLVQKIGEEASQSLFARLFAGDVGDDLRATWFESQNSNERLFARFTAISYPTFLKEWLEQLAEEVKVHQAAIATLSKPIGSLELVEGEQKTQFRYVHNESATASGRDVAILLARLKPFEVEPAPHEIQRFDIDPRSTSGQLEELFDHGETILATLRVFDDELRCERISGWKEFRVP